jgi:Na+/H+ antiporter NhaD/arsenite permease-like protein
MLLIRPLLKINRNRLYVKHILVFFIFLVANIGGLLSPLGDPPLFMGYLHGVPFSWNLSLFPYWLTVVGILLLIFYLGDRYFYYKEPKLPILKTQPQPLPLITLDGKINFLFLCGVIATIFSQVSAPWRELILLLMIGLSLLTDSKALRAANQFSWHPFVEIGILFAGIFIAMKPLLLLLKDSGNFLGITEPWQYFWITGSLSSFLDNAPTYVTFFTLAESASKHLLNSVENRVIAGINHEFLVAISCGAVFMGANTYIGNGPNFMIKSIAEDQGVKMPNFIEYCLYSIGILIPVFQLFTWIFLIK